MFFALARRLGISRDQALDQAAAAFHKDRGTLEKNVRGAIGEYKNLSLELLQHIANQKGIPQPVHPGATAKK